jgi:hypothetical protein
MDHTRSPRLVLLAALASLLLLLPLQTALAGGCCGVATIRSLDTGRVLVATRGQATLGYDLTAFTSFTDFRLRTAAPTRSGPAYEVDRDGWDHLRYYPGTGDEPGAAYYEGLYNGSSEYDHQWFAVPPEQDATLRRVLAAEGLNAGTTQWQGWAVLLVFAVCAGALIGLYGALGVYTRRPALIAAAGQA